MPLFRVVGGPGPLTPLLPYSILAHPSMAFAGVPPGPSPGLPHNMDEGGLASLPLVLVLFPVSDTCVFSNSLPFLFACVQGRSGPSSRVGLLAGPVRFGETPPVGGLSRHGSWTAGGSGGIRLLVLAGPWW